jgi:hypothetical protein
MTRKSKQKDLDGLANARVQRRNDDLGDSFPNDWLEALIVFITGLGVFGGVLALWYLAEQMP